MTRNAQVNTFFTIYEEGANAENLNKLSAARNSMLISQQRFGSMSQSQPQQEGQFPTPDRNVMAFEAAQPRFQSVMIPAGSRDLLSLSQATNSAAALQN